MVENLKITLLKIFVMETVVFIIFPLLELLNKMGLLKERIDLCKKWPKQCFSKVVYQKIFGLKRSTLHSKPCFVKANTQENPMNYRMEENPTFLTFMCFDLNVLYLTPRTSYQSLILSLILESF